MKLEPLPLRTRLFRGEDVDSYSARLAALNHSQVADVEQALRERRVLTNRIRHSPERLSAWRQLGTLHDKAFLAPATVAGDTVSERSLCLHCTKGEPARGKTPELGLVCIKHRRWLGSPQIDVGVYVAALSAERHFRNNLAARGVMHDSFAMLHARDCAGPGIVGRQEVDRRRRLTRIDAEDVLLYPEQVRFARLLAGRGLLCMATDPDVDSGVRHAEVSRKVTAIVPPVGDAEPWRAIDRIWYVMQRLTELRREASYYGIPAEDTYFNLLRLL